MQENSPIVVFIIIIIPPSAPVGRVRGISVVQFATAPRVIASVPAAATTISVSAPVPMTAGIVVRFTMSA
jgi:hypothetical protein